MKSFLVILENKNPAGLENSLLIQHVQHLRKIHNSGNLVVCGPFADDSGAVLIIEAASQDKAEEIIQADPFIKEKYYGSYSITEFYTANEANQYLMDHDQTLGELKTAAEK